MKASLSAIAIPDAFGLSLQATEVKCISSDRAERLLAYVAGWEPISVARSLPEPIDVQIAEEMMTENSPSPDEDMFAG